MHKLASAAAVLSLACITCGAAKKEVTELKTQDAKYSYMLGLDMGAYLKQMGATIDLAALTQGITDTIQGRKPMLTAEELASLKEAFGKKMQEEKMAKDKAAGEKNVTAGQEYLDKNKARPGVITTKSGLQYEIITKGTGPIPTAADKVTVHYKGTLVDGKEFDSSYKRGQPASFPVGGVIPGWSEALQLLPVGSKAKLAIPSALGYGERGAGQDIGPNSVLVFEIELLSIDK